MKTERFLYPFVALIRKDDSMDFRLKSDRVMCVSGPSQSGKTQFVLKLLEQKEELFENPLNKILWCYGIHDVNLQNFLHQKGYKTLRGLPKEQDIEPHSICVLDDLLSESESSKEVTNMCTRAAHHKPCFVIFISQNLFPGGKEARTRSLNTHYYVVFKNPRDKLQFEILARQISPTRSKDLIAVYEDATRDAHGYLFIDFTQECPDNIRYRTNIFESPVTYYALP